MNEIAPGIVHWTAFHEPISARVSSHYIAPAQVVIDPKVPEQGGWDALPGRPVQILLTSGHHVRDARDCAAHFGIPIRALAEAADHAEQAGSSAAIDVLGRHEEAAPGITPIHIGKLSEDEGAYYVSHGGGAIAFADGLNHYGGSLGFFSDDLLGPHPERVKAGLKQAFAGLLERDFRHLLFAHGEPLPNRGKTALRDFLESPVGYEDFGQSL